MDYDDNDFQNQNFQLGGDDNKFPQSLQSFSLPKFDLDEHLQVHLRFDNLVDTDVLLGIQGQDNNWIDDFSSGTSAIEFSSSAANTRTISRHNNVWSEATSSESVEMLLKSVGEDEMNNQKPIAMEADAQNVSNDIIDQVGPAAKEVDNNPMVENITQDDRSMPPNNIERNSLAHNQDASKVARQSSDSINDSQENLIKDDTQKESSSFFEPTSESLVLINEGCNVTGISENRDGLLETIAYQVKVSNNESKAVEINNQNDKRLENTSKLAEELNSSVVTNSNTPLKDTEVEFSIEGNRSNLDPQSPEIETVVVEKSVEADIIDNVEESGSKLIPHDNVVSLESADDLHNAGKPSCSHISLEVSAVDKDVISIGTDITNSNNNDNAVMSKSEAAISESEDKDQADNGSGVVILSVEENTSKIQSHFDGSHSENRFSEQKEADSPKSDAQVFDNADAKEIKITEDLPGVQLDAIKAAASADLVPEQDEGGPSSQILAECIQLNETEANASADSSMKKTECNVDNLQLTNSDIGENGPLKNLPNPQISLVVQPSSHVESSDASQSNLQSVSDKPITHVDSIADETSIAPGTGKDNSDNSDDLPSHGEEQMLPVPPPPSAEEASETHLMAVETGKPSSAEPSCGSPTIISGSENSEDKPEGGNIAIVKPIPLDSKEVTATEDDKSFSFEVGKIAYPSEKDTGNQWKPFPSVQSSETPKTPKETAKGSSEKKTAKPRGKSAKGTSTRKKSSDIAGKSFTTSSASVGTVSSCLQLEEAKPNSRKKKSGSPIAQTSGLPDLNSSVSASTLGHQPFTDQQQVQLRAQIFVYGSLIQTIPPDEACMQSAFGDADGGRSIWEAIWRKSVDRHRTQKSPVDPETPLHSNSVIQAPELETKSASLQSKAPSTSASRSIGKSIAPAILNTPLPLQSPLWNVNSSLPRGAQLDFNQAISPLNPYSTSQTRQFPSNSTPWPPPNPRPGPWAISVQSPALKSATQYSAVPVVETVKVTPVRESSMPHPSLLPSIPLPISIPLETQRQTPSVPKTRKRKKAQISEDVAEPIPISHPMPASIPVIPKSLPTILSLLPLESNTPAKVTSEPIVTAVTHIYPSNNHQMIGSSNTDQLAEFSEETGNKIEQAKLQAEEAASVAASVVSHSQVIWNQLAAQKKSSLATEVEAKLISAAAAAAAAASVAKAAAAAAKVASEAAIQAKMMADEAIDSAKTGIVQNSGAAFDAGKNLTMLTPGSILKGKDKIHGSGSIISAAHEAARKRVEEASAATKRAENLVAIMKAAELAAEAVSQVGTIIAMGDPLPFKLSELVEAGPEASWKALSKANKLKDGEQSDQTCFANKEMQGTVLKDVEQPGHYEDKCQGLGSGAVKSSIFSNDSHERDQSNLKENAFRKGSLVEVISDEDGLKGGWFSARVLDVKDNKVHVCYNNLLSDDGSGQLKEWVSLDSRTNGAPRIRIAHPLIVTKNEGTRKRRREAVSNYVWAVGDRVDAWMRDGWWEGIITEKNQLDETKLTVHFPAGGDSSLVRAWDLRPSLSWREGQWIEWSCARENTAKPDEGDTPQEKRQKLGKLETKIDTKVDSKSSSILSQKATRENSEKAEESKPLNLSAKDTIFSHGKKEDNISEAPKGKRTGPQKEGSGVVFGVPKGPGKKRKFMDVSKHYGSDKSDKTNQGKDSLKFTKYLMPQASRPWRNTSKPEPKGKRAIESKSAGVKSVRSLTNNTRTANPKDSTSVTTASNGENSEKNSMEAVSFPSRLASTESLVAANAVKKKSSSVVEGDVGVKGRITPAADKNIRSEKNPEASGKEISDVSEPRRSNRRIQPTSRLLEGLQSSMIMSKIPTFSHDKSSKTPHRSSSRGNARG